MAFAGFQTSRYRLEVRFSRLARRSEPQASLPVLRCWPRLSELDSELDAGRGSGRGLTHAVGILLRQGLWRRKAQVASRRLGVGNGLEVDCIRGRVAESSLERARADANGGSGRCNGRGPEALHDGSGNQRRAHSDATLRRMGDEGDGRSERLIARATQDSSGRQTWPCRAQEIVVPARGVWAMAARKRGTRNEERGEWHRSPASQT